MNKMPGDKAGHFQTAGVKTDAAFLKNPKATLKATFTASANHEMNSSNLNFTLHTNVPNRQFRSRKFHCNSLTRSRLQPNTLESLQLLHRSCYRCNRIISVQLNNFPSRSTTGITKRKRQI